MRFHFLPFAFFIASFAAQAESPVCVTAARATLRAEPTTKSAATWVVAQNMPFMRLEKKGTWTHIEDVDGEKHWIQSSAISGRVPCAVIKAKTARLRRGPAGNAPLAEMPIADRYSAFKRVGGEGDYVELQDDYGEHYFVKDSAVWYPVTKVKINF